MNILFAFLVVSILAAILAVALGFADKKFKIEKDPKLELIEAEMPGANCGGCGYAGCQAYAEAVAKGEAKIGLCSPGGPALAQKMAEIMGVELGATLEKRVAYVFCKACGSNSVSISAYDGISDCRAAALVHNGGKGCNSGCLGFLSCATVCPVGAITKDGEGNVVVNKNKCIACGKCIETCPKGVIKFIPFSAPYAVACSNKQRGAEVNKVCSVGCIGCTICVKKFPESGCKMDEFLSVIDYNSAITEIAQAAEACPKKIIRKV